MEVSVVASVKLVTKRHWISLAIALVAKLLLLSPAVCMEDTNLCFHTAFLKYLGFSIRHVFCFEGLKVYLVSHHLACMQTMDHMNPLAINHKESFETAFWGQFGMFGCSRRVEKCHIRISAFTMFVTNFTWQQPATSSNYLLTSQVKLDSSNLKFYDGNCGSFSRPWLMCVVVFSVCAWWRTILWHGSLG